ncbi:MAG: hypothetical protein WC781_00910 [Candidatus Pacearchaeota archaeon]|jgi:N5-(carboxyethyl)ornithine synthase
MKSIGFPKPVRQDEKRIALLPKDIKTINNPGLLVFESGYGQAMGIEDIEYRKVGAIIENQESVYRQDIICQPKKCSKEFTIFKPERTIFGWLYAEWDKEFVELLVKNKMSAIAWEHLGKGKNCVLSENSYLAGKVGVLHSIAYAGKIPEECKTAVIGRGNTGIGAKDQLEKLGAQVDVYHTGNIKDLPGKLNEYDILVNCVYIGSDDIIIKWQDIQQMRKGALIVDLACEGIESIDVTKINSPVYEKDGKIIYCVNNIPSISNFTSSTSISKALAPLIGDLSRERPNKLIIDATIIKDGKILNKNLEKLLL